MDERAGGLFRQPVRFSMRSFLHAAAGAINSLQATG
jgi:hypothetical protein